MALLVEDRALLDAFRRGDRAALSRIYLHYAEEVARILTNGFGFQVGEGRARFHGYQSRFEMEDVLHEVFARAFSDQARLGYDGLNPYRSYLFGIARTVVIDDFRSKQRALRRFTVLDAAAQNAPADVSEAGADPLVGVVEPTGNPERDLENAELTRLVRTFLDDLDDAEKEVFRLRFSEGKSLAEVETATGRSPSKVKTMERRLRHRLLERIWKSGYLRGFRAEEKTGGWFARTLRLLEREGGRST